MRCYRCLHNLSAFLLMGFASSLLWASGAAAQVPFSIGGRGLDGARDVEVDGAGNLYLVGSFSDEMDVDPGPGVHVLEDAGDFAHFLAKYDKAGRLQWAFPLEAKGNGTLTLVGAVVDEQGNLYINGAIAGEADFDPGPGKEELEGDDNTGFGFDGDTYLVKYAPDGTFLWGFTIPNEGLGFSNALVLAAGGVYLTGAFEESADFDPGPGEEELDSKGFVDAFVARYEPDGSLGWAARYGNDGADVGYGLAVDEEGNAYVGGQAAFGRRHQPFLAMFEPGSDAPEWVTTADRKDDGFPMFFTVVARDPSGNLYVTGELIAPLDLDPGSGEAVLEPSERFDRFLASYTAEGEYRWAFRPEFHPSDIEVSAGGDVVVAGAVYGEADLDPGEGVFQVEGDGEGDAVVAVYRADGSFLQAFSWGGPGSTGVGDVLPTESGLYVVGSFSEEVDFDPAEDNDDLPGGGEWILESEGETDAFVALYTLEGELVRPVLAAEPDAATTEEDTPVEIDVLANDSTPGSELTVSITEEPEHGTAIVDEEEGTITYTPEEDFTGTDTFTYEVDNGEGTTESTVTVTVTGSNDAPSVPVITSPSDEATLTIGGAEGEAPANPATVITIEVEDAEDPEGEEITYRWELALDPDFEEIIASVELESAGKVEMEITYALIAEALDEAGVEVGDEVELYHRVVASDGTEETASEVLQITLIRGTLVANEGQGELPRSFALHGAYPNPFNPLAAIPFDVPEPGEVSLRIYDALGREVATLVQGTLLPGRHEVTWQAEGMPSGMYLVRMEASGNTFTQKIVLMK